MGAVFQKLIEYVIKLWTLLAGVFAVLIAFADFLLNIIVDMTAWALEELGTVTAPEFEFALSDYNNILGLANHFFPLAEAWALMLAAIPYMLVIVTLRFVKQWIPTMSN